MYKKWRRGKVGEKRRQGEKKIVMERKEGEADEMRKMGGGSKGGEIRQ